MVAIRTYTRGISFLPLLSRDGRLEGGGMLEPDCFDVRSDECSVVTAERWWRAVWYRAARCCIVGLYFAHGSNGRRVLHYVLAPDPVDDRERMTSGVAEDGKR